MDLPARFKRIVTATWKDEGRQWLADLPALVEHYAGRWSLTVHDPFPELSYNYAATVTRADGTSAVLKLGIPRHELRTEIAALRLYDGRGCARLLDADTEGGALLIERLDPGEMLLDVADDEAATRIAAGVMARLWGPLPDDHDFPRIEDWLTALDGEVGPLPVNIIADAQAASAELAVSMGERVLIHGDLHHYNILSAQRADWLAIDPKGISGERACEVGAWLHNPLDVGTWPDLDRVLERRVEVLVEATGLERARVVGWGFVLAVLSAVWTIADNGDEWQGAIRVAESLRRLLR